MAETENINSQILIWARETAGLSLEEAAQKIGLTPTKELSPEEKLLAFESGKKFPTRNQLLKISSVYRRPLLAFYMKTPPPKGNRGEDFRTSPGFVSPRENALLDTLLRNVRARQQMVKSLLEDDSEARRLPYVGSVKLTDEITSVTDKITKLLTQTDEGGNISDRSGGPESFFKRLRNHIENVGVFVLLIGDLGSHHSAISESVFRGFAISDNIAPFIVINDHDAKAAYSFTLVHEFVHILLGLTGVSGEPAYSSNRIERFCNDVASEFLLPSRALSEVAEIIRSSDADALPDTLRRIAANWSVSESMVAYRMHRLGWISDERYRELVVEYTNRWKYAKKAKKEQMKDVEGGPSYYVVRQYKLGTNIIDVVRRNLREELLTHTKAAKILGVNPSSVEGLVSGSQFDFFSSKEAP